MAKRKTTHAPLPLLVRSVESSLSPELLKPRYRAALKRGRKKHRTFGHCYAASEAVWRLLGGKRSQYQPQVLRLRGGTHWYLRHKKTGKVLDPTGKQFEKPVDYSRGVRCPFLTRLPSKRARIIMQRARRKLARRLAGTR